MFDNPYIFKLKKNKMKRKTLHLSFFVIAFLAIFFTACNDEESDVEQDLKVPLSVERSIAKQWYENQLATRKAARTRATTQEQVLSTIDMEPVWEESFSRKNKRYSTVEALMISAQPKSFVMPENLKKYEETGNPKYRRSLTRLIIHTDKETKETTGFTMTIMPSVSYIEKTNFKPFHNSYLKRDKEFSGYIIYHTLDGEFANGWKYTDGIITHIVNKDIEASAPEPLNTRAIVETLVCETKIYSVLVEECTGYWQWNEYGDSDYIVARCKYYWEERDRWEECEWVLVEKPGDTGGGTSTPGGYIPPATPVKLEQIYSPASTLTDTEKNQLSKALSELLKYPQVRDMLRSLLSKNYLITFVMNPNLNSSAAFSPDNKTISFLSFDNIDSRFLFHELIHAVQACDFYDKPTMDNNRFNIELEVQLTIDVIQTLYQEAFNRFDSQTIGSDFNNEELRKNIEELMQRILANGYMTNADLDTIGLIGENWSQYPGIYNDDLTVRLMRKYFKFKDE